MEKQIEKAVNEALKPIRTLGKIVSASSKEELLEKLAPMPPGGAKCVKRKVLEQILK